MKFFLLLLLSALCALAVQGFAPSATSATTTKAQTSTTQLNVYDLVPYRASRGDRYLHELDRAYYDRYRGPWGYGGGGYYGYDLYRDRWSNRLWNDGRYYAHGYDGRYYSGGGYYGPYYGGGYYGPYSGGYYGGYGRGTRQSWWE